MSGAMGPGVDGPRLIRAAALRLAEASGGTPTCATARAAIGDAVVENCHQGDVRVLADEVWDLVEARLYRSDWPTFRTAGGMAVALHFIADFYERELTAATA